MRGDDAVLANFATGILIGPGILPLGQFLNVHKIRVDSDNKR
jgi:hypothetical protein